MNILLAISLVLMFLSIAMLIKNRSKQNRVNKKIMIFTIVLQTLSFIAVSTASSFRNAILSLLSGIIAGVVIGLISKLQTRDNIIYYKSTFFSLLYMSLLLFNQLLLLVIKSYISFMLLLAGIAAGMQLGYNLLILSKAGKIKKNLAIQIIIPAILLLPLSEVIPSYAAENEAEIYRSLFEKAYINNGDFDIKYDTAEYPVNTIDECYNAAYNTGMQQNTYTFHQFIQHKKPNAFKLSQNVWYDGHIDYNIVPVQQEIRAYGADMSYIPPDFNMVYETFEKDYPNGANTAEYKAAEAKAGKWFATYSTHAEYKYEGKAKGYYIRFEFEAYTTALEAAKDSDESWELNRALENDQSKGLNEEETKAFADGVVTGIISRLQDIENGLPAGNSESKEQSGNYEANGSSIDTKPGSPENGGSKGDNPFRPKPVDPLKAKVIAMLSAMLGSLAVLINLLNKGFPGIPNVKVPNATNVTYNPYIPANKPSNTGVGNSQNTAPKNPNKSITPGQKGADGKIYTKNHGWQQEFFPEVQIKSLENTITTLKNDLIRHRKNGDKLMTEIVQDELIMNNSKLLKWKEDQIIINKSRSQELEKIYQNRAKRWMNRENYLESAENIASTISFASDVALSIASIGSSTAATTAAKTFYRTIETLKSSKEVATVLAEGADGLLRGKKLSSVIAEQGAKKAISIAVDKEISKFKELYEVDESTSKSLKRLVAAAEPSAGKIIGDGAGNMGIIDNFGKSF